MRCPGTVSVQDVDKPAGAQGSQDIPNPRSPVRQLFRAAPPRYRPPRRPSASTRSPPPPPHSTVHRRHALLAPAPHQQRRRGCRHRLLVRLALLLPRRLHPPARERNIIRAGYKSFSHRTGHCARPPCALLALHVISHGIWAVPAIAVQCQATDTNTKQVHARHNAIHATIAARSGKGQCKLSPLCASHKNTSAIARPLLFDQLSWQAVAIR